MHDKTTNAAVSLELPPLPRVSRSTLVLDRVIARVCAAILKQGLKGRLDLVLPSGVTVQLGSRAVAPCARIALASYGVFWKSLRRGGLGFAESYLKGEWSTEDLRAVFAFFIDNRDRLQEAGRSFFKVRRGDRAYHASRANTRKMSRQNIAEHYDLGNAFYGLWLDPSMTYSSGLFEHRDSTLEDAQEAKYASVLAALDLVPGQSLLEVGCGWGGLALRAARQGVNVTGLTLSAEQLAWATAVAGKENLPGSVDLRLLDYRDMDGQFDRIASVEMIEAVGEENWPAYFGMLCDRLKPGGSAVLQAITIDETHYAAYRARPDFIQRYIFPGGMLPTKELMAEHAIRAGLEPETIMTFGQSYAMTLEAWRRRFHAARRSILQLGFDERFMRMWSYYLTYCEAGFERGTIDVGLYRFRKSGPLQPSQTALSRCGG